MTAGNTLSAVAVDLIVLIIVHFFGMFTNNTNCNIQIRLIHNS